jgi:hypothetical protein
MKSRLATGTAAAVLLLALGGCAASPAATSATSTGPAPSSSAHPTPRDNSTAQSQPTRLLTAARAASAAKTAETVIGLYARPGITSQAWIDALDPYLTQDAAAAFANTDPSTIPAHKVTGSANVLATSTAAGALVDVPTDAGTYRVFLLKDGDGWLADQITPPRQG